MPETPQNFKPTLVLVHGSGGSAERWNYQRVYFSRKGYEVLAVDLPGHGRTPGPGCRDMSSYADYVESLLKQRGIARPVIGGHSMGGGVVLTMALRDPKAYSGLVLVGTGARLRVLPAIFEMVKGDMDAAAEMMARSVYSKGVSADELGRAIRQLREVDPDVLYGDFEACDRFDIMKEVGSITTPAIVVVGAEDAMTPIKYAEYLRSSMPDARLEIIEGAGHMVMLEQPERFNAVVERFLESLR